MGYWGHDFGNLVSEASDMEGSWRIYCYKESRLVKPRHVFVGDSKKLRKKGDRFRVRVRVKRVHQYKINTKFYRLMSLNVKPIAECPDELVFANYEGAVRAAETLTGRKWTIQAA